MIVYGLLSAQGAAGDGSALSGLERGIDAPGVDESVIDAPGKRRIGMIGLSFKTGTDDLRESPLVHLAEHFLGKGLHLLVYDPEVQLSRLLGANRRFIEEHVPHLGELMRGDIREVIAESELLVGLADPRTADALRRHVRADQIVLDLVSVPQREALPGSYEGLWW